jgi:hypothetical protein
MVSQELVQRFQNNIPSQKTEPQSAQRTHKDDLADSQAYVLIIKLRL